MMESFRNIRLARLCIVFLLSAWVAFGLVPAAQSAESHGRQLVQNGPNIDPGAGLIHGNYCGVGSRPGTRPVDALDAACMHHDACTRSGGLPTCSCNARLQQEADAVARNPAQPPDIQFLASLTAAAAALLICEPQQDMSRTPIRRSAREL
jgi:hypothetical protein